MTDGPRDRVRADGFALDHVQISIPPGSENECRAFYADLVGMTEVEKPDVLKPRGGLWLAAGAHALHLGVEQDFRPAKKAHSAFLAGDLDALSTRLAAAGYAVIWAEEIPDKRRFHTADPFGNRLEFIAAAAEVGDREGPAGVRS